MEGDKEIGNKRGVNAKSMSPKTGFDFVDVFAHLFL
jgi:hypothetical protein